MMSGAKPQTSESTAPPPVTSLVGAGWTLLGYLKLGTRERLAILLALALLCTVGIPLVIARFSSPGKSNAIESRQAVPAKPDVPKSLPDDLNTTHKRVVAKAPHRAISGQGKLPAPTPTAQNCPNGICIGGDNSGNPTVYNYGPSEPRVSVSTEEVPLGSGERGGPAATNKLKLTIGTDNLLQFPAFILTFDKPFLQGYVFTSFTKPYTDAFRVDLSKTDVDAGYNVFKFALEYPKNLPPTEKLFVYIWADRPIKLLKWEREP